MATLVQEVKYIMSNVAGNNNKYWYIERYDNHMCITKNGRVGAVNGDSHEFPHSSESASIKFLETKCREKEKKGYKKFEGMAVGSVTTKTVTESANLKEIVKKQIASNSPQTAKLIQYLTEVNAHNIMESTTMTYNVSSGLFSTPLGIVTRESIDKARIYLNDMSNYILKQDYHNNKYIDMLQDYLMLIPQKVGRKLDPELLYTSDSHIQAQNSILDSLEASLQSVLTNGNPAADASVSANEPKIFSVKLHHVEDDSVIRRISRKFKDTLNRSHQCAHLDVKKVYSVEIESMKAAFDAKSKKIGNVQEYWHGTRASNLLSILKGGLKVPPKSSGHVTGRMFGDGVYFSDQSTKSLNYSYGYWDGKKRDDNCFMFLADVSMGKSYIPRNSYESLPKAGYDSTFAEAHKSGVQNNEMIVYDTAQCNLTYLMEFSPSGK